MNRKRTYSNPILPGFYPDPSICRVDDDYYLITSTFEYFPGLPIFHSKDLINWRQIGHVLDRPSQLNLDGIAPSRGLYAPTIRHHDGTFYVINTLVGNPDTSKLGQDGDGCDNFIVTATDPAGCWSDPHWLDAQGIDPSLFFDDDGRVWYTGNRIPLSGEQYDGHREIWLQQLDLNTMSLVGEKYALWDGAVKGNVHAEAPHIFKKDGFYYLLIAEGGTEHTHAVTIARSKHVVGPYHGHDGNPILTHRHLGRSHPIVGTGHTDMVETQNGEWWMVALAMRPYDGYFYNLGRETFLTCVVWEDGWPIVAPGVGKIELDGMTAPDLPEHRWPTSPACDHFNADTLDDRWNFLRTPHEQFWETAESGLQLNLRPERITEHVCPSFIGCRQQHINFTARTELHFDPKSKNECAGIVLLQNSAFNFEFVLTKEAVRLIKRENGTESILGERPFDGNRCLMKVSAVGQTYSFYVAETAGAWHVVADDVDGRILSTPVAGGFVGAYIGMYASSNGQPSNTTTTFTYFEYTGNS